MGYVFEITRSKPCNYNGSWKVFCGFLNSSGLSGWVGGWGWGAGVGGKKHEIIFFMTYFYRAGRGVLDPLLLNFDSPPTFQRRLFTLEVMKYHTPQRHLVIWALWN